VNPEAEGRAYPTARFVVDPERVEAFRAAVGGPPGVVPPTFLTLAEFAVFPQIVGDPELGLDYSRVLHGEQEYEWHRQPRPGETLEARARIAQLRRRGDLGFVTIETEIADEAGQRVALCRSTMIERGP
jgi:acyl dehydratase